MVWARCGRGRGVDGRWGAAGSATGRPGEEGRPTIRRQPPHAISAPMRQTEMAATSLAAVPPAQYGLSSSSRNAMKRARHTEAHSRMAKSSGGPTVAGASGRLQLKPSDAALVFIVAALHENAFATHDRAIARDCAPVEFASPPNHTMHAPRAMICESPAPIVPFGTR